MAYKIPMKKSAGKEEPYQASTIYRHADGSTVFRINDKMHIEAKSESTRYGFRHIAKLYVDYKEVESTKVTYQNRTWESYEFETVVDKLINQSPYITDKEAEKKKFAEASHRQIESEFKTIGAVASLGEVFGKTTKEKNDWKARMLKAGLGNSGLEMPEDWDTLDEKTKEARLDAVIKVLREKK